jgi:hypothetical protein
MWPLPADWRLRFWRKLLSKAKEKLQSLEETFLSNNVILLQKSLHFIKGSWYAPVNLKVMQAAA